MWFATFKLAVRNLLLHKLRSMLTLLGTILGVASVIAMLAVGEGSKQEALEQIRQLGAANVIVRSVKPSADQDDAGQGNQNSGATQQNTRSRVLAYGLTHADLRKLQSLPGLERVVPAVTMRKNAQHGRYRMQNLRVLGTTEEYLQVKNLELEAGSRFIRPIDVEKTANVVVLGAGAADRLFGFEDPLGKTVLLGPGAYRVIGILKEGDSGAARPGSSGAADQNLDVYIPITAAHRRFGELQRIVQAGSRRYERIQLSEVTLAVQRDRAEELVRPTADMVRKILSESHRGQRDYDVQVPLELLAQAEHEKWIWNVVLGSIAGISLLVGGIGIMNIMLATVTERTREIGIRRAIGAKKRDIIRQFLMETTVLSTTGGLLGILLGVGIPLVVTATAGMQTSISTASICLAFGISVATGIVFGVYPAYKAASMSPIEALRHQ